MVCSTLSACEMHQITKMHNIISQSMVVTQVLTAKAICAAFFYSINCTVYALEHCGAV